MISVEEWDSMLFKDQERYIEENNIKVCCSHNVAEELTRGFGKLDEYGFWEYQLK